MSRTHRTHLSKTDLAKRGGTSEDAKLARLGLRKSHKQRRVNARVALRREYL
jgi:hypothetical protein